MEMNIITQERVGGKVLKALKDEGLMNRDAAEIFGINPTYLSMISKSSYFHKVPRKAWEVMHDWDVTGKPLREFKSPLRKQAEEAEAQQAQEGIPQMREASPLPNMEDRTLKSKELLEIDLQAPALTSKEKKQKTAQRLRKEFEKNKPPKKSLSLLHSRPGDETITIPRKGEKVDLSKIDIRTGALVTFEVFDNEIQIRIRR